MVKSKRFIRKRNTIFYESLVAQSSGATEKSGEALIQILIPINKMEKNSSMDIDVIDVEAYTKANKKPPIGKKYRVKIGDTSFVFDRHLVTGKELLEKAGSVPVECYTLYQKLKGCDFEKIDLTEKVDVSKPGIEHFVVKPPEVFHYMVDGEPETTDEKSLTPLQILGAAGVNPIGDYYLVLVNADGSQISFKDKPDDPIEMRCPALKFISVYKSATEVA